MRGLRLGTNQHTGQPTFKKFKQSSIFVTTGFYQGYIATEPIVDIESDHLNIKPKEKPIKLNSYKIDFDIFINTIHEKDNTSVSLKTDRDLIGEIRKVTSLGFKKLLEKQHLLCHGNENILQISKKK